MKSILFTVICAIHFINVIPAQNVGIGIANPLSKLHVQGNLFASTAYNKTAAMPTASQTLILVNNSTLNMVFADSVIRLYDPGGAAGNYVSNLDALFTAGNPEQQAGYEMVIESMNIASGDSIIITDGPRTDTILAAGNGNNRTGTWYTNSSLSIRFKSNADAINGPGFAILLRRLFVPISPNTPAGAAANSFLFNSSAGALRTGRFGSSQHGLYSFASGYNPVASGQNAVAIGSETKAAGINSFASGQVSVASGNSAVALGLQTTASGSLSFAAGANSVASGSIAVAIGAACNAIGEGSLAIGYNNSSSGIYSCCLGYGNTATGFGSFNFGSSNNAAGTLSFAVGAANNAVADRAIAIGVSNEVTGENAFAIGNSGTVSGENAIALGTGTTASGNYSTVAGRSSTASGSNAVAIGYFATASGINSMALGSFVSTSNETGSLVIGDISTTTVMNSGSPNSFRARFAGGYRFYTSSDLTTNALLSAGSNAWSTSSDKRLKENFLDIDGGDFLQKIAAMKLTSWNYKQQDAVKFRHYGPMAQDFYAAFGHDGIGTIGNDTTINQADFDGVNLIAIQALEKRTADLKTENQELQSTLLQQQLLLKKMQQEIDVLKKRK